MSNKFLLKIAFAFVLTTVVLGMLGLAYSSSDDDGYLDLLNGVLSLLIAALVVLRLCTRRDRGIPWIGWVLALAASDILAMMELYEGRTEAIEQSLNISEFADVVLWALIPIGLFLALRAERVAVRPMSYLIGGFVVQMLTTGIHVAAGWSDGTVGNCLESAEAPIELFELVALDLYVIGLWFLLASQRGLEAVIRRSLSAQESKG